VTGQQLLLLLWTLWLVVALLAVGGRPGVILALAAGGTSLGLVLAGVMSWRASLMAGLAVATLAAASRAFVQVRRLAPARQPPPQASVQHTSMRSLPAWVERWPQQVMSASVSLAGLTWLLILRPPVPWVYGADIPIMIGTVAALVAAEYRCWRIYENVNYRLAKSARQLGTERKQREKSQQTVTRNALLEKRIQEAAVVLSEQRSELKRTQTELHRTQTELHRTQTELHDAQAEQTRRGGELAWPGGEPRGVLEEQGDSPVWYGRDKGAITAHLASLGPVTIEQFRISTLTLRPDTLADEPDGPDRVVRIIVQRRTEMVTPAPGDVTAAHVTRAEKHLRDVVEAATANYAAQNISGPTWTIVNERWVATSDGFTQAASALSAVESGLHDILLRDPMQLLSSSAGLPGSVSGVIGGFAAAVPLPIDRSIDAMTRVIQVGGILVGAISGNPVLISACFKSLAHSEFVQCLETGIQQTLKGRGLSAVDRQPKVAQPEAGGRHFAAPVRGASVRATSEPVKSEDAAVRAERLGQLVQPPGRNGPEAGPGFSPGR
jgi:hypothetical protein